MATIKSSTVDAEQQEAETYPYPYTVNVKLSGEDNYLVWKTQMLCLIEAHDVIGFSNGSLQPPPDSEPAMSRWQTSDALVRGWVLGSVTEELLLNLIGLQTAKDVWVRLETSFATADALAPTPTTVVTAVAEGGEEVDFGGWKFAELPEGGLSRFIKQGRTYSGARGVVRHHGISVGFNNI